MAHEDGNAVPADGGFLQRWILANGWSEAAGLGTTFVLGALLAPAIARTSAVASVLLAAAAAIALGMLLEGVVVGIAQERVLRRRLIQLPSGAWVRATTIGAGIAWALGMMPSTVLGLMSGSSEGAATEPSGIVQYSLAVALGLVAGPVLGFVQWTVLRRYVRGAGAWLWANALAWALAMPVIFLGMDHVPWSGPALTKVAAIYVVCGTTGVIVGAVHGSILGRLLRNPSVSRVTKGGALTSA